MKTPSVATVSVATALGFGAMVWAQDACDPPGSLGEQISGPDSPNKWKPWLDGLVSFRNSCLASINYNASIYEVDELKWAQTSFMQPQMHPYDRFFYSVEEGFTVKKWLDDLNTRYGGIDSALIWPTYTNIGCDSRSQFELITAMPGGIDAITNFSAQLQKAGVQVLWPYNPWDTGTHRDSQNRTDAQMLAWLCNATNTQGFNGDTMTEVDEEFYQASVDLHHPIVIEPEDGGTPDSMNWDTMGWGYWDYTDVAPDVSLFKWLDSRWMTNVCDRWNKNKTDNLQYAYFNGAGYETWENVWGTWNEIVPADAEAIRRVGTILRFFGSRGFITSPSWTPHYPTVQHDAIFATQFPLGKESMWTFVNRGGYNSTGQQLKIPSSSEYGVNAASPMHYYDCYHGDLVDAIRDSKDNIVLSFDVEANGYGCIFATTEKATMDGSVQPVAAPAQPKDLNELLSTMKHLTRHPLAYYRKDWTYLLQEIVPSPTTKPNASISAGMKRCPTAIYRFDTQGQEIEGDDDHGVDVQFAWEQHPRVEHSAFMTIDSFDIDEYPVTVDDYYQYLQDSKYLPTNAHNWLKDDSWTWPAGKGPIVGPYGHGPATVAPKPASKEAGERPVVHVGINEARKYCAYYGKRLPQVWEWQYAAQGGNGSNLYPWGPDADNNKFPSTVDSSLDTPPRQSVHAYDNKGAASPFGVKDLVGNIWQYTTELQDIHTRAVLLKGSANYYPNGSSWYFPQALQLNSHNKYFLMDDSYERAATIGFRCARDAPASPLSKSAARNCKPSSDLKLCARLEYTPGYIDLTELGTADWVHYGDDINATTYETRKANSSDAVTISKLTIKSNKPTQFTDNAAAFSWKDGPAVASPSGIPVNVMSKTTTGVFTQGSNGSVGLGFVSVTAKAGHTATARIFLGVSRSEATFDALLTDGKGVVQGNYSETLYTADGYPPATAAQFVVSFDGPATVQFTWGNSTITGDKGGGNVNFQAITVATTATTTASDE